MSECSGWILPQGVNYVLENVRKVVLDEFRLSPGEKVVYGLEKGGVIGVGDQVHYQRIMVLLCCYAA